MRAPSHVVTYVLSDVEGSTELWDRAPDAMRGALDRHDDIIRRTAERHTGRVLSERGEGDSSFTVFARAADAIAYALDLQEAVCAEAWPTPLPLKIRVGVHTGQPGDSYLEPGANACARVRDLAAGGQVLVSGSTASRVRDVLPAQANLRDLGRHRLRGLAAPEQILQLVHPSVPDGFPALRSLSIIPNNLPVPLTSFIGRAAEIDQVRGALRENRLVTLVGTGGAGKTRLAIEAAEASLGDFIDGAWLIELLNALPGEPIDHLIAGAVGVPAEHARDALAAAAARIGESETLVIADNCEHVVEHAARAIASMLQVCPNLRVLATSREVLRIQGECVVEVEPLAAPSDGATPDTIGSFDSVRLFIERARLQRPDLRLDEQTVEHVSSICRRLDGLPLALELAAARTRLLSVPEIDARLDQMVAPGPRGAPDHHQTLEASIAWSVDQLSEEERALFLRLSVFAGGWTLGEAEEVCGFDPFMPDDVSLLLASLVDRSLVSVQQEGEETRFRMLETVRTYAARALDPEDARETRMKHLAYFSGLANRASEQLDGPAQAMWLDRLARADANLMAALREGIAAEPATTGVGLAANLASYWERRGHVREGMRWLGRAIEAARDDETPAVASAHLEAGDLAFLAGQLGRAHEHLARAQEIARRSGADNVLTGALASMGNLHHHEGDYEAARASYEELLVIARARTNPTLEAEVLGNLGSVAHAQNDLPAARGLYERSLEVWRAIGNHRGIAGFLYNLSMVASSQRDYVAANAYIREGLEIATTLQDPRLKGALLTQQARVLVEEGDLHQARTRCLEALAERRKAEDAPGVAVVMLSLAEVDYLAGDPAQAFSRVNESLASFRSFRMRLAEASALSLLGDIEAALGRHEDATARFREVMLLASKLGDRLLIARALEGLATVCSREGSWVRATELIGIAMQIRRSIGIPRPPSRVQAWERMVSAARSVLGDAIFESLVERGSQLDPDSVFSLADEA